MKSKQLANAMTQISEDIVWPIVQETAKEHNLHVKHPFISLVGSGKRTYHACKTIKNPKLNSKNTMFAHCVTYGQKMVASKFNKAEAKRWLSGREIENKNFYNGEITVSTLLAHTIIHEMAHVIQTVSGDRVYKSVHNAAFYKWLHKLHEKCANEVLVSLEKKAEKLNISLEFDTAEENTSPRYSGLGIKEVSLDKIYKCQLDKQNVIVKPFKINRKTVGVKVVESKSMNGSFWKISPFLLHEIEKNEEKEMQNQQPQINTQGLTHNNIKLLKKYKVRFRGNVLTVEVKKKNTKTASTVVIDKNSEIYGKTLRVPYHLFIEY